MTISQLKTFQAVAELRHFAKAASLCNLSQPAVSHQIAQLEQHVGARLFNRTGGRVSLTVVGEVLLEEARRVLSTLDRADERVREAARGAIGRIRFGASPTAGLYLLADLLVRYRRQFPTYELHLEIGPELGLLDRVTRNDLDMAVVAIDIATADLRAKPIASDQLVAVASPASSAAGRLSPEQLSRESWILREEGSDTRRRIEAWLAKQQIVPARTLTLVGPDAVKRAAEAGLGIAILSSWCVEQDIAERRLKRVQVNPPLPTREYAVIDHPQKHHGAACRAMLSEIEAMRPGSARLQRRRPAPRG
jgi:DNA-binding transcriptional LysR family regulator